MISLQKVQTEPLRASVKFIKMQCFKVTTRLAYVIVFVNLILMSEAKSVKRYKRRNEDLLNNLNSTFATLMNFMMVDPSENAQLSKEFTKEFSKDPYFNADAMQPLKMEMPADYQDLLSNNSVFHQQLNNYDSLNGGLISSLSPGSQSSSSSSSLNSGYSGNNGYNQISARGLDQSSLSSNYFNQLPNKNSYDGNSYSVSPEQFAQAPTYMENPPISQLELSQADQLPPTNLIVDDNFNQFNTNSVTDSDSSGKIGLFKSANYLPNYSDLSKYGKIKVSDFVNTDSGSVAKSLEIKSKPNMHFYELVNDDNTFPVNDFKKKPLTSVSSSTIPLKNYNEESRKAAGGFRSSFTPEFDLDQFQVTSMPKSENQPNFKIDTSSNYFDKTRTKDPISEPARPEPNQPVYSQGYSAANAANSLTNSITNSLANSISSSFSNGFVNAPVNGGPINGEQRITPASPSNNVVSNRIVSNPLDGMVSSGYAANTNYYNNHLQLPLVYPQNNNQNYETPIEKSGLAAYGYAGSPKYGGSIGHMGGGYSLGHGGGYSMGGHGGGYSMGHGGGYSSGSKYGGHYSMPMISYSSGHKYGGGHYSMPMISHSSGHKGGYTMPGYNIKATVNAKVTPSYSSHGSKGMKSNQPTKANDFRNQVNLSI